jgi:phosphoribosylamine--glycine ligase
MRLLIVDFPGSGLDLALRSKNAGHEVKLAIKQVDKQKFIGKGMVDVVDDFRPWLRWSNLAITTDNTKYVIELQRHREAGGLVIAPPPEVAEWEQERQCGQQVFRRAGIPTLPSIEFTDYDKAIAHVKKTMARFVSKPCGSDSNDKAMSYCSNGPADMCYMLERWKRMDKLKNSFVLQEFQPGIEMGVSAWFGPHGFSHGWEENFEFKKLMNDDMGVATGEQGTVLRYVTRSKLAEKVLKPLEPQLRKAGYIGDVDVNCIIDEAGNPWPLEFTTRLGWPAFQLQLALLKEGEDPVQWLMDLTQGKDRRPFMLDTVAIGVVLSIPDYPYSHATSKEVVGVPIYGITPSLWRHLHPCEMMLARAPTEAARKVIEAPIPAAAGDYVLTMTATGETVEQVREKVYRRLERIRKRMPSSPMYRTDIGSRLAKQLPELQRMGYAIGLKYNQNSS